MTMLLSAQVKAQILRVLLAADGEPVPATTLRDAVRLSFPHVAFAEADIDARVRECEDQQWVAGMSDALLGTVWALTAKGTIRAQTFRR